MGIDSNDLRNGFLTTRQVAEYLRTSPDNVRQLVALADLPAYRMKYLYRFRKDEVDEWLLSRRVNVS